MKKRVKTILDNIIDQITGETIVDFFHKSLFGLDIPMRNWSMLNQFICFLSGTQDARGYQQWKKEGRYVTKGAKSIYILAPCMVTKTKIVEKQVEENGQIQVKEEEEKVERLAYFKSVPVFRFEDTDGKPLDYEMKNIDLLTHPLFDVLNDLDITINIGPTFNGEYGSFCPSTKEIRLCTDSEQTFLHELSHAIDDHLGNYNKNDYELGEVVAELSACLLASLYGLKSEVGYTQEYIKSWSKDKHVAFSIGAALERVKSIYAHIENWEQSRTKSGNSFKEKVDVN